MLSAFWMNQIWIPTISTFVLELILEEMYPQSLFEKIEKWNEEKLDDGFEDVLERIGWMLTENIESRKKNQEDQL